MLNHPDAVPVTGDLRLTWPNVVDAFRESHGSKRPVVLSGCPPCQGMSSARGERGKEDDPDAGSRDARNLLVLPIAHATSELKPTFVVVENVPAFLRRKVWDPEGGAPSSAARILCDRLEADYQVFGAVVDLCEFGVPQTRLRAFLVFVRRGSAALEALEETGRAPFPAPTHGAAPELPEVVTLGDALNASRFPPLDAASPETAASKSDGLHRVPVWRDRRYEMVAAIRAGSGGSAWETDDCGRCGETAIVSTAAICPVCEEPLPRPVTKDRDGSWRLVRGFRSSSYRRMDPARPAATVTTASGHIGSDRNIHPWENRVMSPAECAFLQTFPSDFRWGDSMERWGTYQGPSNDRGGRSASLYQAPWPGPGRLGGGPRDASDPFAGRMCGASGRWRSWEVGSAMHGTRIEIEALLDRLEDVPGPPPQVPEPSTSGNWTPIA